jgi:uncharacterized alkaline shock family protein YloU
MDIKERTNFLGNIYISHQAISKIASQTVASSYGIVGLAAKNLSEGLAQVITKNATSGVDIHFDGSNLVIDIYIIIEYGTRIKSVATSVSDNVRFQVEKTIGLPVKQVNVHVRGLRISNTD